MPRSRTLRVTGTSPAAAPRSRLLRVTGTGAVPAGGQRSRLLRVTGSGAAAVIVAAIPDPVEQEPGVTMTVTAALLGGESADTWTFRRVSGLAVGLSNAGPVLTFETPSHINGGQVVIGVTATKSGIVSPEVQFTVTVRPQTEWWWNEVNGSWLADVQYWGS